MYLSIMLLTLYFFHAFFDDKQNDYYLCNDKIAKSGIDYHKTHQL